MTIIICALGALLGLVVALLCGKFVLPTVLARQEEYKRERKPSGLMARLLDGQLTTFIYRFVMPFVFAVVGAVSAYQVFVGDLR